MSYSRNGNSPKINGDPTYPRFHMDAVHNPVASAAAGRPIYDPKERVQIYQPGSTNSPVFEVTDEYRERWPKEYEAFRRGEELSVSGTPLEQWPFLKKTHVLELKGMNIHTVEQCAALSDIAIQKIGMGGRSIREAAKAYLDDGAAMAIVSESLARTERVEAENAQLRKQLDELKPMMDNMYSELMALKSAPHPSQTYVPGNHDPVQLAAQMAPREEPAGSSLDSLQVPRRPRQPREASA